MRRLLGFQVQLIRAVRSEFGELPLELGRHVEYDLSSSFLCRVLCRVLCRSIPGIAHGCLYWGDATVGWLFRGGFRDFMDFPN